MTEGCKRSERPVATSNFEMFSKVFSNRVEIFAVFKGKNIFDVFVLIKFGVLSILHKYYMRRGKVNVEEGKINNWGME